MVFKKHSLLISIILFSIFLLISYGLFEISKSRTFQFFGEIISRVPTEKKVVALTFDDAPTEYTKEVLEILKQKKIKATFYIIGKEFESHPEIGKTIVQDGHALGNHTYSHERMLLQSQAVIDKEIQATNNIIREAGYKNEITFRPPYGKKLFGLPWYLQQHNIRTIMWDVEPDSYVDKKINDKEKTEFLIQYTVEHTKPGSIILLHPFCKSCTSDRKALGPIIDKLQQNGYAFVTIPELLKYKK